MRLLAIGLYIEREMMKQQGGQLKQYFSQSKLGILILRGSKAELEFPYPISFLNESFKTFTGQDWEKTDTLKKEIFVLNSSEKGQESQRKFLDLQGLLMQVAHRPNQEITVSIVLDETQEEKGRFLLTYQHLTF